MRLGREALDPPLLQKEQPVFGFCRAFEAWSHGRTGLWKLPCGCHGGTWETAECPAPIHVAELGFPSCEQIL